MLESLLRVQNFWWAEEAFRPPLPLDSAGRDLDPGTRWDGQFARALASDGGARITLIRDRLGTNKLFFAIHSSGRVLVANYLIDLAQRGVPCEASYSVPAGHIVRIDLEQRRLVLSRYAAPRFGEASEPQRLATVGPRIRWRLERWFGRLAEQFGSRKIFVCVSGGLDSGLIAALAQRYFFDVTAYTYSFTEKGGDVSEDACYGRRLAEFLGIPFRLVPASAEDVLAAVEPAVLYGQDWRDFNVHCAIVNELLASAMARDLPRPGHETPALVLTGDLMNEFLADYTPLAWNGREYYRLPGLDREALRAVLVRGLDAGDREIGVFGWHELDLVQPYGLVSDLYLGLPSAVVREGDAKQKLGLAVAGDLLPAWIFDRSKVRAQVGDSKRPIGILPVLSASGWDGQWLRKTFCRLLGIKGDAFLNQLIRAGVYRCTAGFPRRVGENGYLTS